MPGWLPVGRNLDRFTIGVRRRPSRNVPSASYADRAALATKNAWEKLLTAFVSIGQIKLSLEIDGEIELQ
jgi:hypothetical protein